MKFPALFGKDKSIEAIKAQDQAEKLLVESFRMLSGLCTKLADFIEAQRLARSGYERQGKYLERLDLQEPPKPPAR